MWGDVLSLNVEMCYFLNVEMYVYGRIRFILKNKKR